MKHAIMLLALVALATAFAQSTDTPSADEESITSEEATETTEEAQVEPEEDPLGELSEEEMDAAIDRFDPSEKISEDRSVSFPNDI